MNRSGPQGTRPNGRARVFGHGYRQSEWGAESGPLGCPPVLLRPREVAELLGVSPRQVRRLGIPRYMFGPRTIRFSLEDLNEYIAKASTRND